MRSAGHVSWFADIGLADRADVGGKGANLGELQRAGIVVPPGFVVRTGAFERFIQALEREAPVRSLVESLGADDLPGITACSNTLRPPNRGRGAAGEDPRGDHLRACNPVRRRRCDPGRRALFGHHRGCGRRQFRRATGHVSVGQGFGDRCCGRFDAAGRACIRWNRSATAATAQSRSATSPWPWSSRRWSTRDPRE